MIKYMHTMKLYLRNFDLCQLIIFIKYFIHILLTMLFSLHEFNQKCVGTKNSRIRDKSNGYPCISGILIIKIFEKYKK